MTFGLAEPLFPRSCVCEVTHLLRVEVEPSLRFFLTLWGEKQKGKPGRTTTRGGSTADSKSAGDVCQLPKFGAVVSPSCRVRLATEMFAFVTASKPSPALLATRFSHRP